MYHVVTAYEKTDSDKTKIYLEQIRLINYHVVAVQNSKIKKPKQLYKLPWETETVKVLSQKEFDDLINHYGIPE